MAKEEHKKTADVSLIKKKKKRKINKRVAQRLRKLN